MPKLSANVALISLALCASWMLSGIAAPFTWQTRYDEARLMQCLALGLLLGVSAICPGALVSAVRRSPLWIRGSVIAGLALGLISASRSHLPDYAFCEVAFTAALLAAGFGVHGLATRGSNGLSHQLILIAAFGALALGFRFGTEYLAAVIENDARGLESSWIPFLNPRYFAKAATWILPVLWLAPSLTAKPYRSLQWSCAAAAVLIWSQLLGSGSRGALLGMAAGLIAAAIFFGRTGRAYAIRQSIFAVVGLLLWSFFVWFYGVTAPERIASTGLSGRSDLYRAALADIQSAPLLGVGPMHYSELGRHAATSVAGTHNLPLQFAAEWGLPAMLLMLAALLGFSWRLFALTRQACASGEPSLQSGMRVAMFCAIAAALVHSVFANVANEPISQTLMVLLAGLFPYTANAATAPEALRPASLISRVMTACILMAVAAGLLLAVNKGWHCVGQPNRNEYVAGFDGSIYPRLWSQGLIPLEQTCHTRASAN